MRSLFCLICFLVFSNDVRAEAASCADTFSSPAVSGESQDEVAQEFEKSTEKLVQIRSEISVFSTKTVSAYPELQQLVEESNILHHELDEALSAWQPDHRHSHLQTSARVATLQKRMTSLSQELQLWKTRLETTSFDDVRKNRLLILPNRFYQVKTDRGDVVQMRFSRQVVREFFWPTRDSGMALAATRTLEALGRGLQTSKGHTGFSFLNGADGKNIVKSYISGNGVGSFRIYGVFKEGMISFVDWEDSSNHDSTYLHGVYVKTNERYRTETWGR